MDTKNSMNPSDVSTLRLETLLANFREGVLIEDQNRKIIYINPKILEFFSPESDESQILGMDCGLFAERAKDFIKDPESFIQRIEVLLKNKESVIGDKIETIQGKIFSRDFIPVADKNSHYGNLWSYRDITEEIQLIHKLQESERELLEINSFKDKVFSVIAHDLRGPLASLKGVVDLLNDGDVIFESTKEVFHSLGKQLDYTFQLLNNLLHWSANHIKKRDFYPQTIKLSEIIENTLQFLEPLSQTKNVTINNQIDSKIEVFFDKETMSIVVRNLISNALKYTPRSGSINIFMEPSNSGIDLHILDSGIGMSPEEQKNLFAYKSYQSRPGTNKEKGTGIGLLLCKELMELNNGSIRVLSSPGKGSDFILFIPLPS